MSRTFVKRDLDSTYDRNNPSKRVSPNVSQEDRRVRGQGGISPNMSRQYIGRSGGGEHIRLIEQYEGRISLMNLET